MNPNIVTGTRTVACNASAYADAMDSCTPTNNKIVRVKNSNGPIPPGDEGKAIDRFATAVTNNITDAICTIPGITSFNPNE